jgi:hypothetical protein
MESREGARSGLVDKGYRLGLGLSVKRAQHPCCGGGGQVTRHGVLPLDGV